MMEFPILVYRDGDDWVAQSILTCTTAVSRDHKTALEEVCQLLSTELATAFEDADGDAHAALRSITCPASDEVLRMYYSCARQVELPEGCLMTTAKTRRRHLPDVSFTPREVALA